MTDTSSDNLMSGSPDDAPETDAASAADTPSTPATDAAPEAGASSEAAEPKEKMAAAAQREMLVDEAELIDYSALDLEPEVAVEEESPAEDEGPIEEVTPLELEENDPESALATSREIPPMDWYILKVASNRERSISDALRRRVAVAGYDDYFGEITVPTEQVVEYKGGKKKVVNRKLYPGYIVVHLAITDETWFLVRETPGIGDFTGSAGRPTPMLPSEVDRIVKKEETHDEEAPRPHIGFSIGDRVKINEGTFESFEGDVDVIDETNGRVTVMINIFGRSTPVELEHWQIESL